MNPSYEFGAGSFSRGTSERKGNCSSRVPFLCCAVKGISIPELELTSTNNALERGDQATSGGDVIQKSMGPLIRSN